MKTSTTNSSFPSWAEPRYRCIKRISTATTATVWLVRRAGDGMRLHVLKELHGADKMAEAAKADLPREVALLMAQKHPFILPVVELLQVDARGQLGMVTEYCDQGDLHSLLIELRRRSERVPESQLLSWLAQLCLALSHLHRQRSASPPRRKSSTTTAHLPISLQYFFPDAVLLLCVCVCVCVHQSCTAT